MRIFTLRSVVATIGLAVSLVVTIAFPACYFTIMYTSEAERLAVVAGLQATHLANLTLGHEPPQYELSRTANLIELPAAEQTTLRQRLYDANGVVVIQDAVSPEAPLLTRSMPIVVAGVAVGRVEVATSLRRLLYNTGLVACLGLVVGTAVLFAVRVVPLKVLYRTFATLEAAERRLQEYLNLRFEATLENMSQGLCMFNPDGTLATFNRQFADIFKIPLDANIIGMTATQVLDFVHRQTDITEENPELVLTQLSLLANQNKPGTLTFSRTDGHVISVTHRPMADDGWLETFDDITEQRRAEETLSYMAHHDMLTGLPNRILYYERLEKCLSSTERNRRFALFSLDLDNFKAVNDTLGHPAGDRLLQDVAERLRRCVRKGDLVARVGGDEFGLLQVDANEPHQATALALRLIESVSAPYDIDGRQVVVGMSVGVTLAPDDGVQSDLLTKNADLAMYRAKADGGNTFRFFERQMDASMQARREIELDLRRAIVNKEFELHYQPIVNLRGGNVTCLEALVRWRHPSRGLIQPLEFIPIAEETGLIVPLGQWVLHEACLEAARWPQAITVAVNVSAAQFNRHNLMNDVIGALDGSGLPGNRLELEFTESILLKDGETSLATLRELHSLGVRIVMDDFGTGYSSLGYLRSFPFDKIKIDQSFIRTVADQKDSLAIIRAVVGLGSSLGVATTAEGVETREQLECLRAEGCTEVQGFLISRPCPVDDIQRFFSTEGMRPSVMVAG